VVATEVSDTSGVTVKVSEFGVLSSDGFGNFEVEVDGSGTNRQNPLVFRLNNTGLTIARLAEVSGGSAGQGSVFFAAHIAGFTGPAGVNSGFFGGSKPVPEPGLLSLLAAAALGLGLTRPLTE